MDNKNPISTQLQQFLAAPVETAVVAESAFKAHGIWFPGVKLMRNLYFSSKALLISFFFVLPLVLLGYFFVSSQRAQMQFVAQERAGVAVLQHLMPVYTGVLKTRNATRASLGGFEGAAAYQAGRTATDQALSQLDKYLEQTGDVLHIQAQVNKIKTAWAATASSKQGVDEQKRTVFGPVAAALVDTVNDVADHSNLVLDADLDSLYLVNAMVLTLPKLSDDVGQLWGWSTYFSAMAQAGAQELPAAELARYVGWAGSAQSNLREMQRQLDRVFAANPALKSQVDVAVLQEMGLFLQATQDADKLVHQEGLNPQKVFQTGEAALMRLQSFYDKGLPALDGLLKARADRLHTQFVTVVALVCIVLLLAAYFFYAFFLVTRGGLQLISRHLQEMAEGDLRHAPAKPWGTDEPAGVILDLRTAYDALHALIRKVRHSARALNAASDEIASASLDLSARTEDAASMLEEQASTMDEIASTVSATAERARMAATFAEDNASVAEKGGEVFDTVVATMRDIQASSSKIADIIGVIDGIAFQTNILALNAAVEAARAGESGRGFAVVAAEVRGLAQRSAAAAREIKTLISASVEKVQAGTEVVEDAGRTMHDVVTNARQINAFLSEISTAAQEQATGVEHVGQAIQELDKSTSQNAALVEETAGAASSLRQQADILQEEIRNFRVA